MKKDLIILHGALGSKKQFEFLKKDLEKDLKVYSFDFSGHGDQKQKDQFGISEFANELKEFILKNGINRPMVFGYSMGGYVALYLETQYPQTLSGIFTLATKFDWNPESSRKESGFLDPQIIQEKVPQYATFLKSLHGDTWEDLLAATARMMLDLGAAPVLNSENLRLIDIPCRITVGNEDRMVSIEETTRFANFIPNSEFHLWEGIQHPFEKVPTDFMADRIREFIG